MLLQQLHLAQSVCLFFSLSARGPNPWSFNEKRWMMMPRQKIWALLWTPWPCIHYKGNNLHSTVNLCPGNGLVITRYILVGQKGSQGKSKLFSLKKTSNVSVASNQSPFLVWTFPTRNLTKKLCRNTSRSESFKAILGLSVSRSESS
jgi:hypothetical protein